MLLLTGPFSCQYIKIFSSRFALASINYLVRYQPVEGYKKCLEYLIFRPECQKFSARASRSHRLIVQLDTSLFVVTKCAQNVQFSSRNIKIFKLARRARINYVFFKLDIILFMSHCKQSLTLNVLHSLQLYGIYLYYLVIVDC